MKIVKYKPAYKKAVIDLAQRSTHLWKVLEDNLDSKDCVGYIALNENKKFQGYIIGIPLTEEVFYVNHWATKKKNKEVGLALVLHAKKEAKEMGFTKAFFHRVTDNKFHLKEL